MMSTNSLYETPSPLEQIEFDWSKKRNLTFYVKRDDLIHSAVSGNKWRKLKYNIFQAKHLQKKGILTFGGAYSNHLLATAHVANTLEMKSIGIVRGEELTAQSNTILQQCQDWNMDLQFISREEYRLKDDYEYINELKSEFSDYLIVPEGGKNYLGIIGCQEIVRELDINFDEIWLAQGTCTTSIGLALSLSQSQNIQAVPVLSGFDVEAEIQQFMSRQGFAKEMADDVLSKMIIHMDYSFGGYGKRTDELIHFIHKTQKKIGIQLDPVYTAKAFYAMVDFYEQNEITDRTIVFLHTGGLIAGENLM